MPGRARHDDFAYADLARDRGRMQRTGAAIGDEREASGVETALRGDALHRIGHLGRGDAQYAVRRFRRAQAERLRHTLGHRAFRGRDIELHLAAEEAVGAEPAEQEIGVGDRRLGAAAAVAGGSRHRAGAARPDMQRAAVFDPRDRAAAGADFENIDGRDLDRQGAIVAADQRAAGRQRPAAENDAGLGGGAAHVEGDGVLHAERMAQRLRADHAGRWTRFQNANAFLAGGVELEQAAGRLHDEERAGKTLAGDAIADLGEIALHARPDKRIGHDGRAALEFAIFLRQFMRRRNEDARQTSLQDLLGAQFVIRIAVAMQKQDRDRFDLFAFENVGERMQLGLVQRLVDAAVGIEALRHFVTMPARHQRQMLLEEQVIGVGPIDAADLVDVAESARRHQRGLGAGALQHGVDGDRRAVEKQARLRRIWCPPW